MKISKRVEEVLERNLFEELSYTEMETVELIAAGYNRNEVCEIRNVKFNTVRNTIGNVIGKLGLESTTQVITCYFIWKSKNN